MADQSRYRRMSEEETFRLIDARIHHEDLFTKKFYRRNENWTIIRKTANLLEFTPDQLRSKWNNLYKTYKELRNPPTGKQTENGELTAANWQYFEKMHQYGSCRHTINPPLGWHSQRGAYIRNPNNSFTGDGELNNSSSDTSPHGSPYPHGKNQPGSSRQLARNYQRDGSQSRKRPTQQDTSIIYKKYLRECKRQKKDSKCSFNFLGGFSNFIGIPFKPPSESESSSE